ncbi:MAG TPA: hypothetical protein VN814_10210, partial [Caulobacteraceae bacterium]|nr:hypothetical protein [Caulobacteraceae bacterium]
KLTAEFEQKWSLIERRLSIIPGKQFIENLSTFLQVNNGFSLSTNMILDELRVNELDPDLLKVLSQIQSFCAGSALTEGQVVESAEVGSDG